MIAVGYDPVEFNFEAWMPQAPLLNLDIVDADIDRTEYADVVDVSGASGQGNTNPRSLFLEHFVFINGQYYDPSSGLRHSDLSALESNFIDGFFKYDNSYPVNEQVVNVDLDGDSVIENTNVYVEVFLFRKNPAGTSIVGTNSNK